MDQKLSVSIKAKSREIGKELERIILSVDGFRLCGNPKERPNLLIFELNDNVEDEFKLIETLLLSNSADEVFVTSKEPNTNLLLQAMRAGAKEFLTQPIGQQDVQKALEAFKTRSQQSAINNPTHNGKIIHVMGTKGGVGTTTVAVNLAMILSELKKVGSVALVDLNTVFGEIPLFMSLKPTYHWGQIIKNIHRLDSTFLLNTMAKHASGVHILPSPSYLNGHPPATVEIMEQLLNAMKSTFDYIIVDGGQSLDGPTLKGIEISDYVVLITLLNLPCLNNTKNVLKSLTGLGTIQKDKIRLVINRHLKRSDISIMEAEESVHEKIFWNIPNDYKTSMSAINRGMPLYDVSPRANITKSLAGLTDALIDGDGKKPEKKVWGFFRR